MGDFANFVKQAMEHLTGEPSVERQVRRTPVETIRTIQKDMLLGAARLTGDPQIDKAFLVEMSAAIICLGELIADEVEVRQAMDGLDG